MAGALLEACISLARPFPLTGCESVEPSTQTAQSTSGAPGWYEDPSLQRRRRGGWWSEIGREICEQRVTPCARHGVLGFQFELATDDATTAEILSELYSDLDRLHSSVPAKSIYVLKDCHRGRERYRVWADGSPIGSGNRFDLALSYVSWLVNRGVVTHSRDDLLFHAAVATCGDEGVLLPAAMESGKTTLVAGLVASGLSYLSDEVGALDLASLDLKAYPKPLSVDPGSYAVLDGLSANPGATFGARTSRQWQVPPRLLAPGACCAKRARLSKVVFPRYQNAAPTALNPVARVDALGRLVQNSFNFSDRPAEHLRALGDVLEEADCYELVSGDLASACDAILGLYGMSPEESSLTSLLGARVEAGEV